MHGAAVALPNAAGVPFVTGTGGQESALVNVGRVAWVEVSTSSEPVGGAFRFTQRAGSTRKDTMDEAYDRTITCSTQLIGFPIAYTGLSKLLALVSRKYDKSFIIFQMTSYFVL